MEAPERTGGEVAMERGGYGGGVGISVISERHNGGCRATVMGRTGPQEERKAGPAPPRLYFFPSFLSFLPLSSFLCSGGEDRQAV